MKLATTIARSLQADLKAEFRTLSRSVEAGVRDAGQGLKTDLRRQVTTAGLGQRLARTWRERTYANTGIDAASLVWSKAPHIVRVFDEGTVLRSRDGFWLAIPTPAAPAWVMGKRVTPARLEQAWGIRLRFVYRRTGASLLVADGMRARTGKRGGFAVAGARAQQTGRGLTSVPMFFLVPQVRMPKRLDVERAARKWARELPKRIDRRMRKS